MSKCTVIIPSPLTSAFAQDTRASDLDSNAVSRIFEQSLTARGRHLPSRTWLRKWKTDSWMQPLFSRTFELSPGAASLDSWLAGFSHLVGHVSLSVSQGSEKRSMTSDGCSTSLPMESPSCSPECSSPKTSKDCSPRECQTVLAFSDTASRDWKGFITALRAEYSQRLKLAHLTNVNGSSSWPSPVASEVRQGFQDRSRGMKGSQESLTTVVVKNWPTPNAADSFQGGTTQGNRKDPNLSIAVHGQVGQMNGSTDGSRRESYRLNARWCETLMGLPVGWTMPSCASPVTIERTSCGYSETVSYQLPPS